MNAALDCIPCLVRLAAEAVRLSFPGVSHRSDLMRCVLSEVARANIFGISRETPGTVGEMINAVSACGQRRMTVENIIMFQMGTHPA